jgi:hypothetical protein
VAENSDARAEDRPDRPEVPGSCGEADDQPDGQHDDDHRQVGREVDLHAAPRRLPSSLRPRRIVTPDPVKGQITDQLLQLGGGVSGERGLQPGLVLIQSEIALHQCLAQLIRGQLPLAVTGSHRASR